MAAEDKLKKTEKAEITRRTEHPYFQPAVDICETAEALILTFDMPGVSKENVDITIDKGTLTIVGKADPEQVGGAVYRETRVGDYQRQFTLTEDVDSEHITAEMNTGVLTLKIPKPEKVKPKKIRIKAAG